MRRELDRRRQNYSGRYEQVIKEKVNGFAATVIVLKISPTLQLNIFHSDDVKNRGEYSKWNHRDACL